MSAQTPRGRLFRKYVVFLLLLVGSVLVLSSLVELYFSFRENEGADRPGMRTANDCFPYAILPDPNARGVEPRRSRS